ncbi:MAG TPA: hypothetical protein VFP81_10545 [Propionibacteriaceae bacterium]|nr:hypothetical protein [Propionibacteriaceae bacterium]
MAIVHSPVTQPSECKPNSCHRGITMNALRWYAGLAKLLADEASGI